MHFAGLNGMPRRVPDYPDVYYFWNSISSLGSVYTFLAIIFFFFSIVRIFNRHLVNKDLNKVEEFLLFIWNKYEEFICYVTQLIIWKYQTRDFIYPDTEAEWNEKLKYEEDTSL